MKTALLAFVIAFTTQCLAAERDCPIDDRALLKHLQSVAKRHAGSKVNADQLTATWSNRQFTSVRVELGGCEHFGLNVLGTIRSERALPEDEVLGLAKQLARAVLFPQDATSVARTLDRREYTKTKNEDAEVFSFQLRGFQEFGLAVVRRPGVVEISLGGTGE